MSFSFDKDRITRACTLGLRAGATVRPLARSLAQEYQSELRLLHVMGDSKSKDGELTWASHKEECPYHEAAKRLHQSVPAETHLWCEVTHVVREGIKACVCLPKISSVL
jgi:hypothetical protein